MGLFFNKKKKNVQPPWRNSEGKIECTGDSCVQNKCDESCPIWLNTIAMQAVQSGYNHKAQELLEKAKKIAPDFYDAWNNLGAIFAQSSDYKTAYEHYLKAHELNPAKFQPVLGLALTSRDLRKYGECLKWCDKYDKLATDHRCDGARTTAQNAIAAYQAEMKRLENLKKDIPSPKNICISLSTIGHWNGLVYESGKFYEIPELSAFGEEISKRIFSKFQGKPPHITAHYAPLWAAFAGMGATYIWHKDPDSIRDNSFLEILTERCNHDNMEDYYNELLGLRNHGLTFFTMNLQKALSSVIQDIGLGFYAPAEYYENIVLAMFYYGIMIEMKSLGLK